MIHFPQIITFVTALMVVLSLSVPLYGQSDKQKAQEKGMKAVKLIDEQKYDEALILLEDAKKLDPKRVDYPYEIALIHAQKQNYKKSIKILEELLSYKDVTAGVYQLLGNCYDYNQQRKKALDTYEKGLKLFPNSGKLYLELGVVAMDEKQYNKALDYHEKGIKVEPKFASNYYWATILYFSSTETVWGMIYGEIFMNLERNTKRTAAVSKLLYDQYKKNITFPNDTSASVSFTHQMSINLDDLKNNKKPKMPFGGFAYELTLMTSILTEKEINITSLDRIRTRFVKTYFEKDLQKLYPVVLFDYQNKVLKAGHIEAYNYWILMKGEEDSFDKWQKENKDKWDNFVKWFNDNQLEVNEKNFFHSSQF